MPGGLIMSALAAEVFRADSARDDVALLDTLQAMSDRLNLTTHVANPVGGTLTGKQKYLDRVTFLRDKLTWLLPKLAVLKDADCTLDDAKRAWRWVFNHSFWETPSTRAVVLSESAQNPSAIWLRADASVRENGSSKYEYRDGATLPKDQWIQFSAEGVSLSRGDKVHWIAENTGAEAVAEDDLGHVTVNSSTVHSERTAYTGTHRLIFEVRRGNVVIARGVRTVSIA
jgi:hypothetical protein